MTSERNPDTSVPAAEWPHHYVNYGLHIASSIRFPELPSAPRGTPDVTIRAGRVQQALPHVRSPHVLFDASDEGFLLRIENVAGFLVSRGTEIVVDRAPGANESAVRLCLLGSAMGALLHQRGLLPLHGSAIRLHDRAVIFVGLPGRGKSTLAAALSRRGYPVLADDITAVKFQPDTALALPGYPHLKLRADSLDKLGETTDGLSRVRADEQVEKFALPVVDRYCAEPLPVARVYVLRTQSSPFVKLEPLRGMVRLRALLHNTYRPRYVPGLDTSASHFAKCSRLARQAEVAHVLRPKEGFKLDLLLDALEKDWATEST